MQSLRAGERVSSFPGLLTGVAGACLGLFVGSVSALGRILTWEDR